MEQDQMNFGTLVQINFKNGGTVYSNLLLKVIMAITFSSISTNFQ